MKTYVLTVSRVFPSTHKRKGEPTYFVEKIENAIGDTESCNVKVYDENGTNVIWPKIHTIRSNYPLWERRIKEVQEGKAVLSLRYWSGRPYSSKQVEFVVLDKDSGCGVQKVTFQKTFFETGWVVGQSDFTDKLLSTIAQNDGLSLDDFKEWFKKYDLSKPMAIIHFTRFRY